MTTFLCDTVACTLRRGVVVKRTLIHKRKIILMSIENTMGSGGGVGGGCDGGGGRNDWRMSPGVPRPRVLLRVRGGSRVGDLELFTPARRV